MGGGWEAVTHFFFAGQIFGVCAFVVRDLNVFVFCNSLAFVFEVLLGVVLLGVYGVHVQLWFVL